MTKTGLWALGAAGALGALASLTSCVKNDDTSITVAISSEAQMGSDNGFINSLTINVQKSNGSTAFLSTYALPTGLGLQGTFPQTLAFVPSDSSDLSEPITITVSAYNTNSQTPDQPVVARTATVSYVDGLSLLLPMTLRMACFETTCGTGEACIGGKCVAPTVEQQKMVPYSSSEVFGDDPATCFDDDTCLASPVTATPDLSTCTFPLPAPTTTAADGGARPSLNASIQWVAAPSRIIVLDGDDADEGWTVSSDGTHGVLSPGVCAAFASGCVEPPAGPKSCASSLQLSTGCAAKQRLQPHCASDPASTVSGAGIGFDAGADASP